MKMYSCLFMVLSVGPPQGALVMAFSVLVGACRDFYVCYSIFVLVF